MLHFVPQPHGMTTSSSAKNEELILSSRTPNYAMIPGVPRLGKTQQFSRKMNSLHFLLQFDLGYPAMSGLAPILISDLAG